MGFLDFGRAAPVRTSVEGLISLPGHSTSPRQAQSIGDAAHSFAGPPDDARARNIPLECAQAKLEQAPAEARTWESRARESERAREQIALRMDVARRAVYDANLRLERAKARAEQAEARARQAEVRAEQAEVRAEHAEARARQAEAATDALLSSTTWRMTWPLRTVGQHVSPRLRRAVRRASSPFGSRCD